VEEKYFEIKAVKHGPASAVIAVLKHKKLIEWSSCSPVRSPLGDGQSEPPIIVWRFIDDRKDFVDKVLPMINAYSSAIDWEIRRTKYGNKFKLAPKIVWELSDMDSELFVDDAAGKMEKSNPKFGVAANQDVLKMAAYLDENL